MQDFTLTGMMLMYWLALWGLALGGMHSDLESAPLRGLPQVNDVD